MEKTIGRWDISFNRGINYSIRQKENIFNLCEDVFCCDKKTTEKRFIVIDAAINDLYGDKIRECLEFHNYKTNYLVLESGEKNKSVENFIKIFNALDDFDVDRRNEPLIAIGGGVVTDIVSFVASCYRRGVPHITIPTTLMGYIDASIGIKTGIDFNGHKNRMGSFYAPRCVYLDRFFLETLPLRHIRNGVGEIIKIALIKDALLFAILEKYGVGVINERFQSSEGLFILSQSITDMLEELEPNLYEEKLERCVDFGHTFSPKIEMLDIDNLLHGEAVSIDIAFSSYLAFNRGLITSDEKDRIFDLIKKLGLPYYHEKIEPHVMWNSIEERVNHRGGFQRIPLPYSIGNYTFVNDVTEEEIINTCNSLKNMVLKNSMNIT